MPVALLVKNRWTYMFCLFCPFLSGFDNSKQFSTILTFSCQHCSLLAGFCTNIQVTRDGTGSIKNTKYNDCPKTRLCSLAGWDVRFTQNITNGDFFRLNNLIHGTKCDNTLQESFVTRHVLSRSLTRNVNMKHFLKIQS